MFPKMFLGRKLCISNSLGAKYVSLNLERFVKTDCQNLSKVSSSNVAAKRTPKTKGDLNSRTSKQIMKVVFDSIARQLKLSDIYPKYASENTSGLAHKPKWRTQMKFVWPEEFVCEGTGLTKADAERDAASKALLRLKKLGVLDETNAPIISNQRDSNLLGDNGSPVSVNEFGGFHPTMLIYQIYQNVCNAFSSYEFKPKYESVMRRENQLIMWDTMLTVTWPKLETFSASSCKKGDAEKEASLLALKHLRGIGAVDKQLNPIVHSAKEIREFRRDQRLPHLLTLSDDLLGQMEAFVTETSKMDLSDCEVTTRRRPDVILEECYDRWTDVDAVDLPYGSPLEDADDGLTVEATGITAPGTILDAFTGQPYRMPSPRLLESRNLELYRRSQDADSRQADPIAINLTITERRREILELLDVHQAVVLVGDTGCGKTTQVPQFLLDDHCRRLAGAECNVVITQPRRLSAYAVAKRVAEERGEPLAAGAGGGISCVGYRVRLGGVAPRRPGRLLFCSTGVLLRRFRSNPDLLGVSHVIVDEVHERDTLVDLLLTLLRDLIARRPDLRVLLMSATMDHERLSQYFHDCPVLNVPGFLHPVVERHLPEIRREFGLTGSAAGKVSGARQVDVAETVQLIEALDRTKPKSGAILCFLPGWKEILAVRKRLIEKMPSLDGQWVLPLHSKLAQCDQASIFESPPEGVRKIVLATDIAETSITVDDVVYVIDCGLHRQLHHHPHRGVDYLDTRLVSRANARQRRGRAGRTQPGECYRLYAAETLQLMPEFPVPAMRRTSLESTVLDTKAYFPEAMAADVLSKTPDPPDPFLVSTAVQELRDMGILDDYERLTPLGRCILNFGLNPRLAKAVVFSSLFGCVDPIITLAAVMSNYQNIFLNGDGSSGSEKQNRGHFVADSHHSDHLLHVNAFDAWHRVRSTGSSSEVDEFCAEHHLNADALAFAFALRRQMTIDLHEAGLVPSPQSCNDANSRVNRNSRDKVVVKCLLAAALSPHMLHLRRGSVHKGRIKKTSTVYLNQDGATVDIQNDSVICADPDVDHPWLVYFHSLHSADRRQEVVSEATAVPLMALLLFSGRELTIQRFDEVQSNNVDAQSNEESVFLAIDGSDIFKCCCNKTSADTFRSFRKAATAYLNWLLVHPAENDTPINRASVSSAILDPSDHRQSTMTCDPQQDYAGQNAALLDHLMDVISTLLRQSTRQSTEVQDETRIS